MTKLTLKKIERMKDKARAQFNKELRKLDRLTQKTISDEIKLKIGDAVVVYRVSVRLGCEEADLSNLGRKGVIKHLRSTHDNEIYATISGEGKFVLEISANKLKKIPK